MPRHTQDLVYPSSSEVSRVYCRLQTKILCLVPVPAHMGGQGQAGAQGQHPGSHPWSWGTHGVLECLLGHSWGVCPCWGGGRCFPASSPGRACQVSTASCLAAFADNCSVPGASAHTLPASTGAEGSLPRFLSDAKADILLSAQGLNKTITVCDQ